MGDGAEGQGLLGGRSFPFWGSLGDESSQPSLLHAHGEKGGGFWGKGKCPHSLSRDLDFNFALW